MDSGARLPLLIGGTVTATMIVTWLIAGVVYGTQLAFWRPADDAYYYYDLVRSTWTGLGLSTDGVHSTNGFHPLWYVVLLPFGAVFQEPNGALVAAAQLLGMVLLGGAVAGLVVAGRTLGLASLPAALGAVTLAIAPWRGVASAGVEGALALALLCWFVVSAAQVLHSSTLRAHLMTGILAGLVVLARLDTVIVTGCVLLALVWSSFKVVSDQRTNKLAALFLPPVLMVGTYLLVNVAFTGHPMPITASLKSSFPEPDLSFAFLRSSAIEYFAVILAWIGYLVRRRSTGSDLLLGLAVGATAFGSYLALFGDGVFWWHFVSVLPGGALGAAISIDWLLSRLQTPTAARAGSATAVVLVLLAFAVPLVESLIETNPDGTRVADSGWRVEAERAGQWASTNLPADAMLSMKDSGALGFYTAQPLMNLDGVFSTWEYNEALCRGDASSEMNDAGVTYVAHHRVPAGYEEFVNGLPCWNEGTSPSTLTLTPAQEVYRSEPHWSGGPDRMFVIWRWEPSN